MLACGLGAGGGFKRSWKVSGDKAESGVSSLGGVGGEAGERNVVFPGYAWEGLLAEPRQLSSHLI